MRFDKKLLSEPAIEPVSVAEFVAHAVLNDASETDEEALITHFLMVARGRFEYFTKRYLMAQQWLLTARSPDCTGFRLPLTPFRTLDSVKYYDTQGVLQTLPLSDYYVIDSGLTAKVAPVSAWPAMACRDDAFQITVTVGHALDDGNDSVDDSSIIDKTVFARAKQAVMVLAAHMYNHREDSTPVQLHQTPGAFQALADELAVGLV
jgi:uncharacterized phiE125 gp8 family phage protein